jgi:hypothetical protein
MSLNKIVDTVLGRPTAPKPVPVHQISVHKRASRLRSLMRKEAQVGSSVFGPVPAGHSRNFFCLDEITWIWSEQWYDSATKSHQHMLVRYEFQSRGVLKTVNDVACGYVEGRELKNLVNAIESYTEKVASEVYGQSFVAA